MIIAPLIYNLDFTHVLSKKMFFYKVIKFDWNGQVGSVDEEESKNIYKRNDKQKDRQNAMRKTIQTLNINT